MECSDPPDYIDETIGCGSLRRSTKHRMDHRYMKKRRSKRRLSAVGGWFGVEPISTIEGSVSVVRSNSGVWPFTGRCTGLKTDFTMTFIAEAEVPNWMPER